MSDRIRITAKRRTNIDHDQLVFALGHLLEHEPDGPRTVELQPKSRTSQEPAA